MRKSPAQSSRGASGGPKETFKKNDGPRGYSKDARPFKKKNYDGRPPETSSDSGRRGASKPYSGRVAGSGRVKGKPGDRSAGAGRPRKEFDKPRREGGESRPSSDRPKRSFDKPAFKRDGNKEGEGSRPRKEFDRPRRESGESRPFSDRPKRTFDKPAFKKEGSRDGEGFKTRKEFDGPLRAEGGSKPFTDRPKRSFDKPDFRKDDRRESNEDRPKYNKDRKSADSRPFRERPKSTFEKPGFRKDSSRKDDHIGDPKEEKATFGDVLDRAFKTPKTKKDDNHPGKRQVFEDKVFGELQEPDPESRPKKPFEKKANENPGKKRHIHDHSEGRKKKYKDGDDEDEDDEKEISQTNGPRLEMPLNKYIAHSGECSRRDAAELVRQGKVKVNGELVLEPGYKVKHDDKVTMSGKKLTPQRGMVYILLNKPKGFITTNEDPQGRKTVMELVASAGVDRLFPVGRLDRDTSGLLLITNDGDLTQKLCHPAYEVKKVYQVTLDKPLTKADFEKIAEGVELEDGIAKVDAIAYLEKKNELGLEIHSGRNRIVRRIFESQGYVVEKLDRVMYAGLTKKNLPRSKWRFLDEREVVLLKHFKI